MTKRDRIMLSVIAVMALLGGFWMFVIAPQRAAVTDAQTQVETARTALQTAQQKASSGRAAQAEFQRDRTTLMKVGRVVPETDDIPTLLTQLQSLAKKEGVSFRSYAPVNAGAADGGSAGATTETTPGSGGKEGNGSTDVVSPLYPPGSVQIDGGLGRTAITIGLTGKYFNLERYLRAVQRFAVLSQNTTKASGRLIVVDGFSYDLAGRSAYIDGKVRSAGKSYYLKAELNASVYFAPPLEAPKTSASGAGAQESPSTASSTTGSTGAAMIGGIK